jgi:hypothetical protein
MNYHRQHICAIRVFQRSTPCHTVINMYCVQTVSGLIIQPPPSAFRPKTAAHRFSLHSLSSAFPHETPTRNMHASKVNEFRFGLISPTPDGVIFSKTQIELLSAAKVRTTLVKARRSFFRLCHNTSLYSSSDFI